MAINKIQGFILYRIYYGEHLTYLGRTKQPLQERIRGHLFKKPHHRRLYIEHITKIECASFKTEADMNLYEIYFINLWKPPLNVDDKTKDNLTLTLPDAEWKRFETHLWEKWKSEISIKADKLQMEREEKTAKSELKRLMRGRMLNHEISIAECEAFLDGIEEKETDNQDCILF